LETTALFRGGHRRLDEPAAANAIAYLTSWAATRIKRTYLSSQYSRLAGRHGRKRAITAVSRRQLFSAYHMPRDGVDYQDLGEGHFDRLHTRRQTRYHVTRLERMGYQVTLAVPA